MADRLCSVDGCEGAHMAKGFCNKHYQQHWQAEHPEWNHDRHQARKNTEAWKRTHREAQAKYKKTHPETDRAYKSRRKSHIELSASSRKKSSIHRRSIRDDACFYCGRRTAKMVDEHYMPLSRGGTDHWFNIVRACNPCNSRKGTMIGSEFSVAREEAIPRSAPRRGGSRAKDGRIVNG